MPQQRAVSYDYRVFYFKLQGVSFRPRPNEAGFTAGMTISDEVWF